ncbi:MAG: serine protease, partial [Acidobacteria bacterium]|nr:serine protease [Acidobacteriota bacterium]
MANVDLQLIAGLGLPYEAGAESALLDPRLNPIFDLAWQGFVALYPGQTLQPLFDELPVEQLEDLVDSVRLNGEEPPDPFTWFTLACEDNDADAIVTALMAMPMVTWAGRRRPMVPAGFVSYGTNPGPAGDNNHQILLAPYGVDAIYAWQVPGGDGNGVRIVDIEDGWRLDHEDLITADINRMSVFGPHTARNIDHGTGVAGILVGGDNGVGSIGIVPSARLDL